MISTPFRSILQCHYFRLIVYEMIPENSCYAVSIASFLVYFSTYVIILQENVRILCENQMHSSRKWLDILQFYSFNYLWANFLQVVLFCCNIFYNNERVLGNLRKRRHIMSKKVLFIIGSLRQGSFNHQMALEA